ncbi:MAG: transposase [Candidatus Methanomethyliales bacterium]|nr:transposase [Candidatus Methanomethylicales archaeon]
MYQVRAYNIKHNYDLKEFLEAYRLLLQKAIDEIWANMTWIEKTNKNGRERTIPIIPKEGSFKHHYLRSILMNDWNYSKHYVDSAIKQAYSILKSWRRSYVKGKRSRNKPVVKKKFVRIKETLYSYRDGIIKVSVKPFSEYLEFDVSRAWLWSRVPKDADMGELILKEKYLTITFRFEQKGTKADGKVAWDCNERSLDGFNPKLGWIRVDLARLFHIHRVHELKRKRLQSLVSRKPSLNKVLTEYSRREKDRAKDFAHKLTTSLSRRYEGYNHGFERLRKEGMLTESRAHNREITKSDWKRIITLMGYKTKSRVKPLDPYNSTKGCSRCGMINAPKGALYECKCGLKIDRHLNASINPRDLWRYIIPECAENRQAAERFNKPLPSDGGSSSKPERLLPPDLEAFCQVNEGARRCVYEVLERVHPDRGRGL